MAEATRVLGRICNHRPCLHPQPSGPPSSCTACCRERKGGPTWKWRKRVVFRWWGKVSCGSSWKTRENYFTFEQVLHVYTVCIQYMNIVIIFYLYSIYRYIYTNNINTCRPLSLRFHMLGMKSPMHWCMTIPSHIGKILSIGRATYAISLHYPSLGVLLHWDGKGCRLSLKA